MSDEQRDTVSHTEVDHYVRNTVDEISARWRSGSISPDTLHLYVDRFLDSETDADHWQWSGPPAWLEALIASGQNALAILLLDAIEHLPGELKIENDLKAKVYECASLWESMLPCLSPAASAPQQVADQLKLAWLYGLLGHGKEASEVLEALVSGTGVAAPDRTHLALELERQGEYLTALDMWQRLWLEDPQNKNAVTGQICCLLRLEKPGEAQHLLEMQLSSRPTDLTMLAGLGLVKARSEGWQASKPYWLKRWRYYVSGQSQYNPSAHALYIAEPKPEQPFTILRENDGVSAPPMSLHDSANRVCVYTTLFGSNDTLAAVQSPMCDVPFICFTDRDMEAEGWEVRRVESTFNDPNLDAKRFKVLPYEALPEYNYSLFVDANTAFHGDIVDLFERWLLPHGFVMFGHPERRCVYAEAEAVLEVFRHEPVSVLEQVESYKKRGLPKETGLVHASVIWRDHRDQRTQSLMERWWEEILQHSRRDQLSIGWLFWTTGICPKILPPSIGNSRRNIYFNKVPHRNEPGRTKSDTAPNDAPRLRRNPYITPMPRDRCIRFIYAPQNIGSGSTVLRCMQLSQLIAEHFCERRYHVQCVDTVEIQDAIVVLTKSVLTKITPETLHRVRIKNNCVIADFVDARIRPELLGDVDILLASSIRQLNKLRLLHPTIPSHLVTHHVDTRIDNIAPYRSKFAAAYFGEMVNTKYAEELSDLIDFFQVDTANTNIGWFKNLDSYNFHYAVRNRREIDGCKPFLKGFLAAHCDANILVPIWEGDAELYLTKDYPFVVESDELDCIENMLAYAKESFGGPDWTLGLDIMADVRRKSSREWVVGELECLLAMI